MSRVGSLSEDGIWDHAYQDVVTPERPSLKGRADVITSVVLEAGVEVRPDPPPERHAVIADWPADRDEMMWLAKDIATKAAFKKNPR